MDLNFFSTLQIKDLSMLIQPLKFTYQLNQTSIFISMNFDSTS